MGLTPSFFFHHFLNTLSLFFLSGFFLLHFSSFLYLFLFGSSIHSLALYNFQTISLPSSFASRINSADSLLIRSRLSFSALLFSISSFCFFNSSSLSTTSKPSPISSSFASSINLADSSLMFAIS